MLIWLKLTQAREAILAGKNIRVLAITMFFLSGMNGAYADAPFLTDGAQPLDPHVLQTTLYGTGNWSATVNTITAPVLEFDYGLIPNLEIDVYLPVLTNYHAKADLKKTFPTETGLGDINFELKYRFFQETTYLPQIAFDPNLFLPTGNPNRGLGNGRVWYTLPFSMQKSFGSWTTYAQLGYGMNSSRDNGNYLFGGWVINKQINPTLNLGAEVFTQQGDTIYSPAFTILNLGGTYKISSHFNLLASVGHSIRDEKYWVGYLGLICT